MNHPFCNTAPAHGLKHGLLLCACAALPLWTAVRTSYAQDATEIRGNELTALRRIYLSVHGLDWVGVTEDDPRRDEPRWEQWPGRCAALHPLDFGFRHRIYQMIRRAKEDEGLLILPSGNPQTVEVVAWGGDWCGCAATYPIQMGRALGLAKPVQRRWDLIIRDCGPMWVNADLVVGDMSMSENIQLSIFRNERGRYCATYWEGLHSPLDRAHVVSLEFPAESVRLVNGHGRQVGNGSYGPLTVSVGAGGHTPHRPDILEAAEALALDDFVAALRSGIVAEKPLARD